MKSGLFYQWEDALSESGETWLWLCWCPVWSGHFWDTLYIEPSLVIIMINFFGINFKDEVAQVNKLSCKWWRIPKIKNTFIWINLPRFTYLCCSESSGGFPKKPALGEDSSRMILSNISLCCEGDMMLSGLAVILKIRASMAGRKATILAAAAWGMRSWILLEK